MAVCFFMDGLTTPFFKAVGNVPDDNDALISLVMGPVRASTDCFTTWVGIGPSTQDLVLERRMMSLIEASLFKNLFNSLLKIYLGMGFFNSFGTEAQSFVALK